MFQILFFRLSNGKEPANEFIRKQDAKTRAKILTVLEHLKLLGNKLRDPYSKYLEDGIFELRIRNGNNQYRVLYFFFEGRKIILTNGFIKKTQKTPITYLEQAKNYRRLYLEEYKDE